MLVNATIHGDPPNVTTEISCPVYNDCCQRIADGMAYWLEGVIQVTLGIIGILMNLASCCILGSKEMRNAFNLLLIALCLFDSGYLLGAILESFRKSFKLVRKLFLLNIGKTFLKLTAHVMREKFLGNGKLKTL